MQRKFIKDMKTWECFFLTMFRRLQGSNNKFRCIQHYDTLHLQNNACLCNHFRLTVNIPNKRFLMISSCGGTAPPWGRRWATSISSLAMGGCIISQALNKNKSLSSSDPDVDSGIPWILIEPLRFHCPMSSVLVLSAVISAWSVTLFLQIRSLQLAQRNLAMINIKWQYCRYGKGNYMLL